MNSLAYSAVKTDLGEIFYIHDGKHIFSLFLGRSNTNFRKSIRTLQRNNRIEKRPFQRLEKELIEYSKGQRRAFSVKADISYMNPFARKVLKSLKRIRYGSIATYGDIAKRIGKPKSARAVGNALGSNPIPLLIPCHRVIRGDGSLGGFGCGVALKKRLLKLESGPDKRR